ASVAWTEQARRLLVEAIAEAGADIRGQSFSLTEIYTGAPAHLLETGAGELAWTLGVAQDGARTVVCVAAPEGRWRVRLGYEQALVGARTILSDAPQDILARGEMRAAAAAAGLIELHGDFDATPMPMRVMITRFHNKLAAATA